MTFCFRQPGGRPMRGNSDFKKWRKLIELDPIFAIEDAFVGTGVDMTKKSQILREWLNKNIIIDDETGMRIMMDGLVEITDLN